MSPGFPGTSAMVVEAAVCVGCDVVSRLEQRLRPSVAAVTCRIPRAERHTGASSVCYCEGHHDRTNAVENARPRGSEHQLMLS